MFRRERPRRDVAVVRRRVVIDDPGDGVFDACRCAAGSRGLGDRAGARRLGECLAAAEGGIAVVRLIASCDLRARWRACPPRGGVRDPVGSASHIRRTCTSRAA